MRQIRLCWRAHIEHAEHEIDIHREWAPVTPEVRRDLSIIARTANELYGPHSHWVEEREARRPQADPRLRFDPRVLRDDAAAGPYARHLAAGVRSLRFEPELEREYLEHVRDVHRRPASACLAAGLVAWMVFGPAGLLVLSRGWLGADRAVELVQWGMALVLGGSLVLLRAGGRVVRTDAVIIGVLASMALVTAMLAAQVGSEARLPVALAASGLVMATFFPLGLVFRQSLVLALAMALGGTALVLTRLFSSQPTQGHLVVAALWGVTGLAALGGYLIERLYREQFLFVGLLLRQAFVDPATGLHTRRGMHWLAQTARLQALRDGVNLSFVLIDVDRFRDYNRRYGRAAGDRALSEITRIVDGYARRPLDVASREGGNRFGLLLYDCNLEQARLHAEQLRERLRELGTANTPSRIEMPLTVSIGAVQVLPEETADDFMRRVEELLQQSKAAGRDRVTVL